MEANLQSTLIELKQLIQQLSIRDRWALLKWLVELLQQAPQNYSKDQTKVNFDAVHRICNEISDLPVLDSRSPDEIIGYNKLGGFD
ncbi:MAG: hypothetical protein ACFBSF_02670 [Leptolyngbyaceae cyanobacterium]